MLLLIRLYNLDDFKKVFDKALQRGEPFAIGVIDCTQSFMLKFDKIYEGILSKFV